VCEESLRFFSEYCIGSLWGETCSSVIDGKLQLKHASASLVPRLSHLQYLIAFVCKYGGGRPGRFGHVQLHQVDKVDTRVEPSLATDSIDTALLTL